MHGLEKIWPAHAVLRAMPACTRLTHGAVHLTVLG